MVIKTTKSLKNESNKTVRINIWTIFQDDTKYPTFPDLNKTNSWLSPTICQFPDFSAILCFPGKWQPTQRTSGTEGDDRLAVTSESVDRAVVERWKTDEDLIEEVERRHVRYVPLQSLKHRQLTVLNHHTALTVNAMQTDTIASYSVHHRRRPILQ